MVSREEPVAIIAEIGSTHDGSLGIARNSIEVAAQVGVDAVKFQTHIPEAETLSSAPAPSFFSSENRFDYFKRTGFSFEHWIQLQQFAESVNVQFLSSPFSFEALQPLEKVGMKKYKIPSGEVTNIPLLEEIARTGKPIILSSGMSSWNELDDAVNAILKYNEELTILQCTSEYPCPYENVGLDVMVTMKPRYGKPVGFSDHTVTNYAAYAAVTLGASVIEKHFTLSQYLYGSDAKHSTEPFKFQELVEGIRAIEVMQSSPIDKDDLSPFGDMKNVFQKSVVSVADIPSGSVITADMLGIKKPGTGIAPKFFQSVVGRQAARTIPSDTVLLETDLIGGIG